MNATIQSRVPGRWRDRGRRGPVWRRGWFQVLAGMVVVGALGLGIAAMYVLGHAEPIVRERLIETLAQSFNSSVELDSLHISLLRGIEVEGHGLRIPYGTVPQGANASQGPKPLLSVDTFRFRTGVRGLMRRVTHVDAMALDGVKVHIPSNEERLVVLGMRDGRLPADPTHSKLRPKISFTLGSVEATNAKLFIETDHPGKEPLEFDIKRINLQHLASNGPCLYEAELINARPKGEIAARGHIGPWNGTDPRSTPVDGDYSFQHADLNTIQGIGGMLSSTGHFDGPLERIALVGVTDVPDFSLDVTNRPVPLHTHFQAHVDGTDGDTYLDRVEARLLQSSFTTSGKVVKIPGQGHDIALDVTMDRGRIQDMLLLGVKTRPPLMNGALAMRAKLHIPPGRARVIEKLDLRGHFTIRNVHFSNAKLQDRVDGLSARAQGKPQEVTLASQDRVAEVGSQMAADFTLVHGLLTAENVRYEIPGATVLLHGVYSTDGNVFEFKGHVRTEARASQMVGGWKGWLLKPLDPFLAKHGAGVEAPIEVSGTGGDMHFGVAFNGADESSASMERDLKEKRAELHAETRRRPDGLAGYAVGPARTAAEDEQMERAERRALFASGKGSAKPSPMSTISPRRPDR